MKSYDIDWSFFATVELLETHKNNSGPKPHLLDIGSGPGVHTNIFRAAGFLVTQIDKYSQHAEIKEGFLNYSFEEQYDYIFCSHVIEHQRNCGLFLDKIRDILKDDGSLIISAPKHDANLMVEGHINSYAFPLFLQQLVLAGFDCKNGKFLSCGGIENSFIVPKALNFRETERDQDAYVWTEAHQERSFVYLKNQHFESNKPFFRNCVAWSVNDQGSMHLQVRESNPYGFNLKSSRWGISVNI